MPTELGALIDAAEATWTLRGASEVSTTVVWRYVFVPTSALTRLLLRVVCWFFHRWMVQGLERIKTALD